jgi:hypothetical protein
MITKLRAIKLISRIALGLVWFYEGLVPKILFLRADEIGLVRAYHLVWRNTGVHSANSRSRAVARWPLADHRNRGTSRRVYRYPLDVDPYRASREWKSVDANRSVRRAGEGLLSHRVYDHRLDTRTNRGELRRS